MEHIFDKVLKQKINKDLKELVKRIETDPSITDSDGNLNSDRLHEILDGVIQEIDRKINYGVKGWDFSKEKELTVFSENDLITLCPFTEDDRGFYTSIREQYNRVELNTTAESRELAYWEGTLPYNVFYCTIVLHESGTRIGYIAFKNTASNLWEIAIEIDRDHCGKGYGGVAIQLFLNRAKEITRKSQYQALVEVDNIHCQRCMDKLNAELVDIFNLMFEDEDEEEAFANENLDMITDHMIHLAEKLDIEPRKLLTNVLDYRIYV